MEEFRDLDDYYSVSNIGNVRSIRNCCNQKVCKDSKGYSYVVKTAGGFKFSWKET